MLSSSIKLISQFGSRTTKSVLNSNNSISFGNANIQRYTFNSFDSLFAGFATQKKVAVKKPATKAPAKATEAKKTASEKAKEKEKKQKIIKIEREKKSLQKLKEKQLKDKQKEKLALEKKKKSAAAEQQKKDAAKAKALEIKKKEQEKKDAKPKRAKSALVLYITKNYAAIKKQNATKSNPQIFKAVTEKWNKLTEAEKKPYLDEAKKDKIRYDKEVAEMKKNAPPKRPLNGYLIYVNSIRAQVKKENPSLSMTQLTSKLSDKWNNLSDAEKTKYNNQSQKLKDEYEKKNPKQAKTTTTTTSTKAAPKKVAPKKKAESDDESSSDSD